jgi:hypothetical protein
LLKEVVVVVVVVVGEKDLTRLEVKKVEELVLVELEEEVRLSLVEEELELLAGVAEVEKECVLETELVLFVLDSLRMGNLEKWKWFSLAQGRELVKHLAKVAVGDKQLHRETTDEEWLEYHEALWLNVGALGDCGCNGRGVQWTQKTECRMKSLHEMLEEPKVHHPEVWLVVAREPLQLLVVLLVLILSLVQ